MKLTIPLTGTVLREGSVYGDGLLSGDPDDPIRPIDIDLGNVSWRMVDVDMDAETMTIEVTPAEELDEDTGQVDGEGEKIYQRRPANPAEKAGFLLYARQLVESRTPDELYALSGKPRLKRALKETL